MAETAQATKGRVLSADEFEAALALLVEEERRGTQHYTRQLVFNLAFTLTCVVGLFACPLGTLIRFVDPRVGQPLLITGLVAAAIFTLLTTLNRGGVLLTSDAIRTAAGLDDTPLEASVEAGWRKRVGGVNLAVGILMIPGLLSVLVGVGWLLYDLFVQRRANLVSLALIAWPLLGMFVMTAVRSYQEYVYFSRVAQLRRRFTARFVDAKKSDQPEVALSAAEVTEFAQVQRRSLNATVRQAAQQLAQSRDTLYAIVVERSAQAALQALPAEAQAGVRDQLDRLQQTPRPPEARPTADGAALVVFDGAHTVTYQVDDARQRVTVLTLATAAGEGAHGT